MKSTTPVDPRWLDVIRLDGAPSAAAATPPDETRDKILDAAYELLLQFGLRRTTLEDVARRAGIARPTLYRRFADKDAVVAAVMGRETERSLGAVLVELARVPTVEQRVVDGFVLVTRTAARHPLLVRLLATEPDLVLPHLGVNAGFVLALAHARITPMLRLMQHEGHFVEVDAAFVVETMVRLFLSIVLSPSALVAPDDDASLERFARALLVPMLHVDERRPRKRGVTRHAHSR